MEGGRGMEEGRRWRDREGDGGREEGDGERKEREGGRGSNDKGTSLQNVHGIIVHSIPAREIYTRKNRKVSPPPPQKHTKITHMNTKHSEHHKTQHGSRTLGAQP